MFSVHMQFQAQSHINDVNKLIFNIFYQQVVVCDITKNLTQCLTFNDVTKLYLRYCLSNALDNPIISKNFDISYHGCLFSAFLFRIVPKVYIYKTNISL